MDPTEVLINTPVLSVTTPLGLVYWSAVRASWAVRCKHKFLQLTSPPSWSHFLRTWIKVLSEWEQHPSPSLPKNEITLLLHALKTMDATTVLEHPRVRVASDRPLPTLHQPAAKKGKSSHRRQNWQHTMSPLSAVTWRMDGPLYTLTDHPRNIRKWGEWGVTACTSETTEMWRNFCP